MSIKILVQRLLNNFSITNIFYKYRGTPTKTIEHVIIGFFCKTSFSVVEKMSIAEIEVKSSELQTCLIATEQRGWRWKRHKVV